MCIIHTIIDNTFTLVIIHPLIIAVPNVLALKILLLMSSHLMGVGVPSGRCLVFFFLKPEVEREKREWDFG